MTPNQIRFERKFIPEPFSGCWLWSGGLIDGRYGMFTVNNKPCRAHRIAWQLYRGSIPNGVNVLHRCDTPICVNPDHLFLGTQTDNNIDRDSKNRQAIGEKNGRSKLTAEQVAEIITSIETCRTLAERYGVCNQQISKIKRGLRWNLPN